MNFIRFPCGSWDSGSGIERARQALALTGGEPVGLSLVGGK
jgi:hypothetical protein